MIIAICGEDLGRLKVRYRELLKSYDVSDSDVLKFNTTDDNYTNVLEEVRTTSLFEDTKWVLVNHPSFLRSDFKDENIISDFEKYFLSPSNTTNLIILIDFIDKNPSRLYKVLESVCKIEKLISLDKVGFQEYVKSSFENDGYKISQVCINEIVDRVNFNALLLDYEIEKVKLHDSDKVVKIETIKDLVKMNLEKMIFNLSKYFIANDKKSLMECYYDMLSNNENPQSIFGFLCNEVEKIHYTKSLLKRGYTQEEVGKYFNIPTKVAYWYIQNAKIKDEQFIRLLRRVNKLELDVKSGNLDIETGLELFLLGA